MSQAIGSQAAAEAEQQSKKKPRMTFSVPAGAGQSIQVAVFEFEHESTGGERFSRDSIVVSRSYKEGETWKQTPGFRVQDLPTLAAAIDHVWHRLVKDRLKEGS